MKIDHKKPVDIESQQSTTSHSSSESEVEKMTKEVGKQSFKDRVYNNRWSIGLCCLICPPAGVVMGCFGLGWLFGQCDCSAAAKVCCDGTIGCLEIAGDAVVPVGQCCGYACLGCCACIGAFADFDD